MGETSDRPAWEAAELGESGGSSNQPRQTTHPSLGATSSPRGVQDDVGMGESGGSADLPSADAGNALSPSSPDDLFFSDGAFQVSMGDSSARPAREAAQLGESGGSLHQPEETNYPSIGGTSSAHPVHVYGMGESGGSADLPAEDANMMSPSSPDGLFFSDGAFQVSMGETSDRPARETAELGESGGSFHQPEETTIPSLGATSSPRVVQDGVGVGESGGSADLPSADAGSALSPSSPDDLFFSDGAFQVSMGDSSATPAREAAQLGESGGSLHQPEEINDPSMGGTSSARPVQGYGMGESGGSADLPAEDASNMMSPSSPDDLFFSDGAFQVSMGETSDRPAWEAAELGESGGSSHQPEETTHPSLGATSSPRMVQEGVGLGESGGSVDFPQVDTIADHGAEESGDEFVWGSGMAQPSAPSHTRDVGESGGSSHQAQDSSAGDLGGPPFARSSPPRGDAGSGGSHGFAVDPGGTEEEPRAEPSDPEPPPPQGVGVVSRLGVIRMGRTG